MSKKQVLISLRVPVELKQRFENFSLYHFGTRERQTSYAIRFLLEKGLEVAQPDKISGPYGEVAEFKSADGAQHYGVRPIPYRSVRPNLVLFDVKTWQWPDNALARGIDPLLDKVLDSLKKGGSYTWDMPEYRELCALLGFDPDENRPKFTDGSQTVGERLICIAIQLQSDGMHSRARIPFDLIDLLRIDTVEPPERSVWVVEREIEATPSDEYNAIFKEAISRIDIDRPERRNQGGDVLLEVVYDDPCWRKRRVIERSFFSPRRPDNELVQQASLDGLVGIVMPAFAEAQVVAQRIASYGIPILDAGDERIHERPIEIKSEKEPQSLWNRLADIWFHFTNKNSAKDFR